MEAKEPEDRIIRRGTVGDYHWLTCGGDVYVGTLLRSCSEIVLGKYLAVTSMDGGVRGLSEEERQAGWESRGEIAYSPLVKSIDSLRFQRDGPDAPGYDEWYVFDSQKDLGQRFNVPFWEFQPQPGGVFVFVNAPYFVMHGTEPYMPTMLDIFWKQMEWIQPDSYIADSTDYLTLVSKRKIFLDDAQKRLTPDSIEGR